MQSMTGFARAELSTECGTVICELRSVNHRYLEMSFKLSEAVRFLEPALRDTFKKALNRGKVDVTVQYRPTLSDNNALKLNEPLVTQYLQLAKLWVNYGSFLLI